MTLRSVLLEDEIILSVDGLFDGNLAPDYHHAVEDAFAAGVCRVVVDLTMATAVDGGGAAVLAATAAGCASRGTHLIIAMPRGVEAEIRDPAQVRLLLRSFEPWQDAG
ncbi:STAS domain-containing protein [Amycolatopsis sp. OK19-0408]|uniref:STAS domain-containing protein n=1 Tax=Amycolatopsis iheyensis TaxID=2945988 RepID=A0A9X2SPC1_9PSEU|nr:STAS domain-containing protein [Amycolatopsis iheyensis]MCR6488036.1 STAS domain-containing protein [Amycolatopsis iheyensis]